jgi:hypothetical protein
VAKTDGPLPANSQQLSGGQTEPQTAARTDGPFLRRLTENGLTGFVGGLISSPLRVNKRKSINIQSSPCT